MELTTDDAASGPGRSLLQSRESMDAANTSAAIGEASLVPSMPSLLLDGDADVYRYFVPRKRIDLCRSKMPNDASGDRRTGEDRARIERHARDSSARGKCHGDPGGSRSRCFVVAGREL